MTKPTLILIAGPTAVGKTALTVDLAKELECSVISCDSRQFYKELKIGTARPDQKELKGVPHYFLGHKSIYDAYTVGDFEREVIDFLVEYFKSSDKIIMTGGSGLFTRAIYAGLDDMPEVPESLRTQINEQFQQEGIHPLLEYLKSNDREYYEQVDKQNPARVVRAVEVIKASGRPYSSFRHGEETSRPFRTIKIVIDRPREALHERINLRVDQMVNDGLLEELKKLPDMENSILRNTIGYKEFIDYLEGQISFQDAVEKIKVNSRRLAKRQLTWFRKDATFQWFRPDERAAILSFIKEEIRRPS